MSPRQQVWIESSVQGVLLRRLIMYWIIGLFFLGLGTLCTQYYEHPDWLILEHAVELFHQCWPWLPSLVLLLPLVAFDLVRLSNNFVGPIYRLRKQLADLNADPACRPLGFREDDYWQDLAEPVNSLQAELLRLRAECETLNQKLTNQGEAHSQLMQESYDENTQQTLSQLGITVPSGGDGESAQGDPSEDAGPVEAPANEAPLPAAAEDKPTQTKQSDPTTSPQHQADDKPAEPMQPIDENEPLQELQAIDEQGNSNKDDSEQPIETTVQLDSVASEPQASAVAPIIPSETNPLASEATVPQT